MEKLLVYKSISQPISTHYLAVEDGISIRSGKELLSFHDAQKVNEDSRE
jgi:hypothetical protein